MEAIAVEKTNDKDQERVDDIHLHLIDIYESLLCIPPVTRDGERARQKAIKDIVKIRVQLSSLGFKHSSANAQEGC